MKSLPTDLGTVPEWTLSDRLRKARETAGLSQTELADEIGISRRSVSNYEVAMSRPARPTILAWALRCGVPASWLETGKVPQSRLVEWAARDSNPEPMGQDVPRPVSKADIARFRKNIGFTGQLRNRHTTISDQTRSVSKP